MEKFRLNKQEKKRTIPLYGGFDTLAVPEYLGLHDLIEESEMDRVDRNVRYTLKDNKGEITVNRHVREGKTYSAIFLVKFSDDVPEKVYHKNL